MLGGLRNVPTELTPLLLKLSSKAQSQVFLESDICPLDRGVGRYKGLDSIYLTF